MRINEQIPKPTERDAVAKKRKTPILLAIVSGLVTWASLIVILLVTTGNINQTSPIAGTEREKARVEAAAPDEAFGENATAVADAAEAGIAEAVTAAPAPAGVEQIPASHAEAADVLPTDVAPAGGGEMGDYGAFPGYYQAGPGVSCNIWVQMTGCMVGPTFGTDAAPYGAAEYRDDKLFFDIVDYDSRRSYQGEIEKTEDGIRLTITGSEDPEVPVGSVFEMPAVDCGPKQELKSAAGKRKGRRPG